MSTTEKEQFKRGLGFPAAVAMVVGSMIASGIFMSPQNLAEATNPKTAIIAWCITGIGSIFIALSFANMVSRMPKTGGPVVYTKAAFGEFPAYLVGWSYWIGAWASIAALINGCVRYLSKIFPVIGSNKLVGFLIASAILWTLAYINIKGVKGAGRVAVVTTICKLVPLLVFVVLGIFHFKPELLSTVAKPEASGMGSLPAAIAITMWAFMGLEMGVFPAEETKNAHVFIKKATIWGTVFTAIVYILVSVISFGIMPQSLLANSKAPIADMLNLMTGGSWGGIFVAIGVVISTLGAATGCILVTARCSYACAVEKTFPSSFANMSKKYATPVTSIIVATVLANILLIANYTNGLNSAYTFMMLLSTLTTLPAYIATGMAEIIVCCKKEKNFNAFNFIKNSIIPLLAFVYICYVIYGCGADAVMWGFLLMVIGIPLYVYVKINHSIKANESIVDESYFEA